MTYKGIEIIEKNDKYRLISPINGTLRIFKNIELAKNYINNAESIDSHAKAMYKLMK